MSWVYERRGLEISGSSAPSVAPHFATEGLIAWAELVSGQFSPHNLLVDRPVRSQLARFPWIKIQTRYSSRAIVVPSYQHIFQLDSVTSRV